MSSGLFSWLFGTQPVEEWKPQEADFLPEVVPLEEADLTLLMWFVEQAAVWKHRYPNRAGKATEALQALSDEFRRRDDLAYERTLAEWRENGARRSIRLGKYYKRRWESERRWEAILWAWRAGDLCRSGRPPSPFSRR